ncbi:hypothetical protein ACQV5M_20055, partial [Leptospira sp. SA-E8]|uniref:hypothetical protein n=1 Tax=Leptospira sp. SA-E8 TaxID=3422259 RepID=UPI003EB941E8
MNTVEDAYKALANEVLSFVAGDIWDEAGTRSVILEKSTQTSYWRVSGDRRIENDRFPPIGISAIASKAILFLRNDLKKTTNQRIWGM